MPADNCRDSRSHRGAVLELLPRVSPPDHAALITGTGGVVDHRSLRDKLSAFGDLLCDAGLRDRRIALLMPDGAAGALVALGVMNAATCVPLNPAFTSTELTRLLRDLRADALLVAPSLVGMGEALGEALQIPVGRVDSGEVSECTLSMEWLFQGPIPASPAVPGPVLLLHTSGSTGHPKRVPVTVEQLRHAVSSLAGTLALGPDDRCLNMMPLFHIGGLVDLLLAPLASGSTVIPAAPFSAALFARHLEDHRPTWFQAVPTMLQAIVHHYGAGRPGHRLRFIRAVSSALPLSLHRDLERLFDTPVIEIYGMSETCGQIASNPLSPARRKAGSVGLPQGARVRILDRHGNPLPPGDDGEILVQGPGVMAGYEGSEEQPFSGDWFHSGDQGYLDEDGYLYLTGRLKEMINRGGEKIAPLEIDQAAAAHPAVREAAAFAQPHPSLGETVALAVVPEKEGFDEASLKAFLAERLAPYKIPTRIVTLDALPRGAGGKLQRGKLVEGGEARHRRPPATPMQERLAAIWQRVLGCDDVAANDNFFDLGGDSLKAATLVYELEPVIRRTLSPAILYQAPTVERLEAVLAADPDPAPRPDTDEDDGLPDAIRQGLEAFMAGWQGIRLHPDALMVGHNTAGSRVPLFWCVNAHQELEALSCRLGRQQPVYGMRSLYQVPGRKAEYNLALARRYAGEIEAICPEGPVLLGGYCEGGKFALQIASMLRERGREVPLLALQEQFVAEVYHGPVSLFLCPPESQSWARFFWQPEHAWYRYYRGGLRLHHLPYSHHDCYTGEGAEHFAGLLGNEIDAALSTPERWQDTDGGPLPLPAGAYTAEITGAVPLLLRGGQRYILTVRVRNIGTELWPAGESSGLFLGARWLSRRGKGRGGLVGKAVLPRALKPGFSVVIDLPVQVPNRSSFRYLDIDMVDDGLCWFQQKNSKPLRKPVLILKGPMHKKERNTGKV